MRFIAKLEYSWLSPTIFHLSRRFEEMTLGTIFPWMDPGTFMFVGTTFSSNFPTSNPLQPTFGGGADVFISKLPSNGSGLSYSTFHGGGDFDEGTSLAVNAQGEVFLTGKTASNDFPLSQAIQTIFAGSADVIVSKLDPSGSSLLFSTFIGSSGEDSGNDIALDSSNNVYVTGSTQHVIAGDDCWGGPLEDLPPGRVPCNVTPFPTTTNAFQTLEGTLSLDAFVLKLPPNGSSLPFSTLLGGEADEVGQAIVLDSAQNVYVAGKTSSPDFPRTGPLQGTGSGGFISKIIETSSSLANLGITMAGPDDPIGRGSSVTYTLTVTNLGPNTGTGVTVTEELSPEFQVNSVSASQGGCSTFPCSLGNLANGANATITITGTPLAGPLTLENNASVFSNLPDPDVNDNSVTLTTEVATPSPGPTADLSIVKNDNPDPVVRGLSFTYTLEITNGGPDTATNVIVRDTLPNEISLGQVTTTRGNCTGVKNLTCNLGDLPNGGEPAKITISAIPANVSDIVPRIFNTATVTSGTHDPFDGNNSSQETTSVSLLQEEVTGADLSITVTPEIDPESEEMVFWIVRVFNGGTDTAKEVVVTSEFDKATFIDFRESASSQGQCSQDLDTTCSGEECFEITNQPLVIVCDVGSIPWQDEFEAAFKVRHTFDRHTNFVEVSSRTEDPAPQNNFATATANVVEGTPAPTTSSSSGGGGGGGGCFIATAAYGSPLAREVDILRHFRDQFLLPSYIGRLFVQGYYATSPPLADFIAQHPGLKQGVRVVLWPIVKMANLTLHAPHLAMGGFVVGSLGSLCLVYGVVRIWRRQNRRLARKGPLK